MKTIYYLFLFASLTITAQAQQTTPQVVFDTDMGPDYDDVGAIAVLHALADSGRANILATIASTKYEGVGSVLQLLNTYFNKPSIPVGIPKQQALEQRDRQHWSDTLRAKYPHASKNNSDFPDAVELYRKILAAQPDKSVTIITVGFLTNISNLLQSAPDSHSSLAGRELIRQKVKKMVSMAGKFPSGKEFNIAEDAAASKHALENMPVPVVFSGFEIGEKILSGLPLVNNKNIENSPVKDVFRISIPLDKEDSAGRKSWDQTAVIVGVLGHEGFYTTKHGKIEVDNEGNNKWSNTGKGQTYIVQKMSSIKIEELINQLMMHQPAVK